MGGVTDGSIMLSSRRLSSFSCSMTSFFAMIETISASNNCVIPTKQSALGPLSEQRTYPYRLWKRPQITPCPFRDPTRARQVHHHRIHPPHYRCRAPVCRSTGFRSLARCLSGPFVERPQRGLAVCPSCSNGNPWVSVWPGKTWPEGRIGST